MTMVTRRRLYGGRALYGRLSGYYARLYGRYIPNGALYGRLNYRARFNLKLGYYRTR